MSMIIRYADYLQGVFQLLHLLVKQVILLLSFLFLDEPCTSYIDGWSGFLILENHSSRTFPQTSLTFLWFVALCAEDHVNFTSLFWINPRAALLHLGQHSQRAGRAGPEVEEVKRRARRLLQEPARDSRILRLCRVLGATGPRGRHHWG